MLTALDTIEDKKRCFEGGADDYLTKLVDFDELELRINALFRRYRISALQSICHRDFVLAYQAKTLFVGAEPIELTKKEFLLLYMLASTPGRIYGRTKILDEVWGEDSVSIDRTVDVHINRLREKLKTAPVEIVTVRGLGYKSVLK